MPNGPWCGDQYFPNGITQGYQWYPLYGGMQDFNYLERGCFEITLELSCPKHPPASELKGYWLDNKVSLLKYIATTHHGVTGVVLDQDGYAISGAVLTISGIDFKVTTDQNGRFWRLLAPGQSLELVVTFHDVEFSRKNVTTTSENPTARVEITLPIFLNSQPDPQKQEMSIMAYLAIVVLVVAVLALL